MKDKVNLILGSLLLCFCQNAYAIEQNIHLRQLSFQETPSQNLKTVGAWELSLSHPDFGGFSGLVFDENGDVLAVTDRSVFFRFAPRFNEKGILKELSLKSIKPLKTQNGQRLTSKKDTDSESLSFNDQGELFISFERHHRVQHINEQSAVTGKTLLLPKGVMNLGTNAGLEAIEQSISGDWILIAEGRLDDGKSPLWVQSKDQEQWRKGALKHIDGYRPTGLARIPDHHNMILLERFYAPPTDVRVRLYEFDPNTLKRIRLLKEFRSPNPVDNFEAVAVQKNTRGSYDIFILSDDNFNFIQRTLLVQLEYRP